MSNKWQLPHPRRPPLSRRGFYCPATRVAGLAAIAGRQAAPAGGPKQLRVRGRVDAPRIGEGVSPRTSMPPCPTTPSMFITGSLIAALVIIGTVTLSLGTSFGISVLIWQHVLGVPLYYVVLALSAILLLAVGADYNLLLIARLKKEIGAGLKTGN